MDRCETVLTIPQITGTCWFNALLMTLLYSDGMRKYLINNLINSELYQKNKQLYIIILDILKNKHRKINNNDQAFFDKLKPEKILKLLHNTDNKSFYFDPDKYSGHWGENYFVRLFEYFGLKDNVLFLARHYLDSKKFVYSKLNTVPEVEASSNRDINGIVRKNFDLRFKYRRLTSRQKELILQNNNIDILVITHHAYTPSDNDNLLIQTDSNDVQEVIEYNGNVFKIDSVMVHNFNYGACKKSHQIAGVTCDNKRYMYNGWIRQTIDPAKTQETTQYFGRNKACELMKYDWLTNKADFCLSPRGCGIENRRSNEELCFNTTKQFSSTYIYVRVEEDNKMLKLLRKKLADVTKKCDEDKSAIQKRLNENPNNNKTKLSKELKDKQTFCDEHLEEIRTRIQDITDPKPSVIPSMKNQNMKCPQTKILNPKTNNCVKRNSALGKKLAAEEQVRLVHQKGIENILKVINKASPYSGKCNELPVAKIHEKFQAFDFPKELVDDFKRIKDKKVACEVVKEIKRTYSQQVNMIDVEQDMDRKTVLIRIAKDVVEKLVRILINEAIQKQEALKTEEQRTDAEKTKECKDDQILNPKTYRCVSRTGAIGKRLVQEQQRKKQEEKKTVKTCKDTEILNPKTDRCVSRTGAIGRKLIKEGTN